MWAVLSNYGALARPSCAGLSILAHRLRGCVASNHLRETRDIPDATFLTPRYEGTPWDQLGPILHMCVEALVAAIECGVETDVRLALQSLVLLSKGAPYEQDILDLCAAVRAGASPAYREGLKRRIEILHALARPNPLPVEKLRADLSEIEGLLELLRRTEGTSRNNI